MLDFNSILVFSKDPKKLADFYSQVFQKVPDWTEGGYYGFMTGKGIIAFGPHDKVQGRNTTPERIMFNFETKNVKGECEPIRHPEDSNRQRNIGPGVRSIPSL